MRSLKGIACLTLQGRVCDSIEQSECHVDEGAIQRLYGENQRRRGCRSKPIRVSVRAFAENGEGVYKRSGQIPLWITIRPGATWAMARKRSSALSRPQAWDRREVPQIRSARSISSVCRKGGHLASASSSSHLGHLLRGFEASF